MVVGFVFEHVNPWFFYAINVYFCFYAASIDFFTFVKVAHEAMFFEVFGRNGTKVHEGDWLFLSICIYIITKSKVFVVNGFNGWIFDGDIGDFGVEGGVTAVVRPVRIDDLELGFGWVAVFFGKVSLEISQVIGIHGKTILLDDGF